MNKVGSSNSSLEAKVSLFHWPFHHFCRAQTFLLPALSVDARTFNLNPPRLTEQRHSTTTIPIQRQNSAPSGFERASVGGAASSAFGSSAAGAPPSPSSNGGVRPRENGTIHRIPIVNTSGSSGGGGGGTHLQNGPSSPHHLHRHNHHHQQQQQPTRLQVGIKASF